MGSRTKGQRELEAKVERLITNAHRRGVCDSDGKSIKKENGEFIAKPRAASPSVIQQQCRYCREWYYIIEGHDCEN